MKHASVAAGAPARGGNLSGTVLRALALLDVLVAEPRGLGLSSAAQRAGLSKATAFRLLAARRPRADEADVLRRLFDEQHALYAQEPELAAAYVSVGEAPRDEAQDLAAQAALTAVVQALMNYDEFVFKR